jgi:hypothetical protein
VASLMVALFASPASRAVAQSGYGATLQALINKTQFISVDGAGEMHITGTNLHLENGLGATNGNPADPSNPAAAVVNGKGNLIIGYNGSRPFYLGPDVRTGSHNLVLGDGTNYPSFGGLAAGYSSAITAPYASVSGGFQNTASGSWSSVSGGNNNTASGPVASVSGGFGNQANGQYASVSGGQGRTEDIFASWRAGVFSSGP